MNAPLRDRGGDRLGRTAALQRLSLTHGRVLRVLIAERLPHDLEPVPSFRKLLYRR